MSLSPRTSADYCEVKTQKATKCLDTCMRLPYKDDDDLVMVKMTLIMPTRDLSSQSNRARVN